jgi:HD-like signal output (HDOD) protein
LLHDIGVIAHLWLVPNEFRAALDVATARHISLQDAELEILGITHCESGKFLAEKWHLGEELTTVIAFHHDIDRAPEHRMLTAIVALADLLCRMNAMGYGFPEDRQVDLTTEPAFACLMSESPTSKSVDWARITMEMDGYLEEVRRLVALLFRSK